MFHAKSRLNAGATYFVAGRDPAGMKGSAIAEAHADDDLYDGDHGRYVLTMSPGLESMNILPFGPVYYDKRDHVMKAKDLSRPDDFIEISGTKMRKLAALGAVPCDVSDGQDIPSDLLAAKCIPPGFMVQTGWDIVCDYYQNVDSKRWVPYSVQMIEPHIAKSSLYEGKYGTDTFTLYLTGSGKSNGYVSPWHDITMHAYKGTTEDNLKNIFNMVVEIPMFSAAKMEVQKDLPHNPIMQDSQNNAPRYYSYGVPFFNYGLLPQTWEDVTKVDEDTGAVGDGDPIDVIEVGSQGPLAMGSVVPVKVLGSLALIDEGETDHKLIALRETDPQFNVINSMADLESHRPGITKNLVDWLKNYKTSDGKPANTLKSDTPTTVDEALDLVTEVHESWRKLVKGETENTFGYYISPKPSDGN